MSLKSCGRNNVQKIKQSQHPIQANFRDDVYTMFRDGTYAKLVEGSWRQRLHYEGHARPLGRFEEGQKWRRNDMHDSVPRHRVQAGKPDEYVYVRTYVRTYATGGTGYGVWDV